MNPDPEVASLVKKVYYAARRLDLAETALHLAAVVYATSGSLLELTQTAVAFAEAMKAKVQADRNLEAYVPKPQGINTRKIMEV